MSETGVTSDARPWYVRLLDPFRCTVCASPWCSADMHCWRHPTMIRQGRSWCLACIVEDEAEAANERERRRQRDLDDLADRVAARLRRSL